MPVTTHTATLSIIDPALARAEFFFDLEQLELRATIPQATRLAAKS